MKENGEDRPRELYSVRGFKEGEYDPAIPKQWFSAPPVKLDGKDKEMEALRVGLPVATWKGDCTNQIKFHYLALIRYSKSATTAHKHSEQKLAEAQGKLRTMQDLASEEHAKVVSLEQEVEHLRPFEKDIQKLYKLQARLPAIEHYLKLLPKLAEYETLPRSSFTTLMHLRQNDLMKERLASVGFQMALEPMPNFKEPFPLDCNGKFVADEVDYTAEDVRKTASSHTVGRSAHANGLADDLGSSSPQRDRPLKRPRVDSPKAAKNIHLAPSSRDQMPPPATKPLSRMKSMRSKLFPTIRKKFSNGRASPVLSGHHGSDPDVQMYENGNWEAIDAPHQASGDHGRPPTRHGLRQETPYMSGALPVEDHQRDGGSNGFEGLPTMGARDNTEFTFRSHSPIKLNGPQSSGLPTERSYIRLLDGLGRDTRLDLGIQDPRANTPNHQRPIFHEPPAMHNIREKREEGRGRKRWDFGHAFLNQSPNVATSSAYRQPGPSQYNQISRTTSNALDRDSMNPVTPAPARFQRPVEEVDYVVSPNFESGNRYERLSPRGRIAERGVSLNHSTIYPFPRKGTLMDSDWHQPRGLNGLSFFNSPMNPRNEPIQWRERDDSSKYAAPKRQYQSPNIDSRSFITRPDTQRSPFFNDSTYGSLDRPSFSRQPPLPVVSSPNVGRRSQSRASYLPSAMPSIVSSHSPVRVKSKRDLLGRNGMRGGQSSWYDTPRTTNPAPRNNLSYNPGRRSIRR